MPRKVGHAVHDILEAIEQIEEVTREKSSTDLKRSWQLRWLVQRAIEIISEASRAIAIELQNTRPEIPWSRVRGIGNIVRHQYEGVSDLILWRVVTDELPRLKVAVQSIAAGLQE
jgi:uncharacterized protein with HEPN domain